MVGGSMSVARQLDGTTTGMCALPNGKRCSEAALGLRRLRRVLIRYISSASFIHQRVLAVMQGELLFLHAHRCALA